MNFSFHMKNNTQYKNGINDVKNKNDEYIAETNNNINKTR